MYIHFIIFYIFYMCMCVTFFKMYLKFNNSLKFTESLIVYPFFDPEKKYNEWSHEKKGLSSRIAMNFIQTHSILHRQLNQDTELTTTAARRPTHAGTRGRTKESLLLFVFLGNLVAVCPPLNISEFLSRLEISLQFCL